MPIKAKPYCGKGHERPPGTNCPECSRQRAIARYYANHESINAKRNEKRRGTYRPRPKMRDEQGNPLCHNGHIRAEGQACQLCRVTTIKKNNGTTCAKGHQRNPAERQCSICTREYQRRWRAEHRASENSKQLARYYDKKALGLVEISTEKVRAWRKKNHARNLELSLNSAHRRRAKKLNANGSHTIAEWKSICARQKERCAACGRKRKLTKDHIVPISAGGSDYAWNLQGLCGPCNSRKGATIELGTQFGIFDKVVTIRR